jgi:hypothetical protein
MTPCLRTPNEWFAEAARCYIEYHQGCAWCGGSYRVFHTQHGHQREYYCNCCDFRAGYDAATNRYFSYPGEVNTGPKPGTMFEI